MSSICIGILVLHFYIWPSEKEESALSHADIIYEST